MNYKVRAVLGLCVALLGLDASSLNGAAIHITISGGGEVSPNLDGLELQEGKIYNLRVMPDSGYAFNGWWLEDGSRLDTVAFRISQKEGILYREFDGGYEEALPGDTIQADFVPSPFISRKGTYVGTDAYGSFCVYSLRLTDNGAYSGIVRLPSKRYSFSGLLFADGTGASTIRTGANDFYLASVSLSLEGPPDILTVILQFLNGASVGAIGERITFNARSNPATNFAGKYTLILTDEFADELLLPFGDSFATLIVDLSGNVRAVGKLADGAPFTSSTPVFEDGNWPLFFIANGGADRVVGWPGVFPRSMEVGYSPIWHHKPKPYEPDYPDAYGMSQTVVASPFHSPTNTADRIIGLTNFVLRLSSGGLVQPLSSSATLTNSSNVIDNSSNGLSVAFQPTTGLFAGHVSVPGTNRTVSFQGVVLQNQNKASGFFIDQNHSGRVTLGPPVQIAPGVTNPVAGVAGDLSDFIPDQRAPVTNKSQARRNRFVPTR
jgi:hypothetical protein